MHPALKISGRTLTKVCFDRQLSANSGHSQARKTRHKAGLSEK
jgi:hypothetical protein